MVSEFLYDIFISYKRENEDFARRLRDQIQTWRHRAWMDIFDIPDDHHNWNLAILDGLRECRTLLGVLTKEALQSRNVLDEWFWAYMNNRPIVFVWLEDVDLSQMPPAFIMNQRIDFRSDTEMGFLRLRQALESPQTSPVPAKHDPYADYVAEFYNRTERFLKQTLLYVLARGENPQPITLESEATPEKVLAAKQAAKKIEVDPMALRLGIAQKPGETEAKTTFDNFSEAFEAFDGRVPLLGNPGAGKTTTLLHYALQAALKRKDDPRAPLPLLALIGTWDTQSDLDTWLQGSYDAPKDVGRLLDRGEALLLLDGLDELGSTRTERDENGKEVTYDPRQRFLSIIPQNNRVLVTSRIKDYDDIGDKIDLHNALTLQPLSDEQMEQVLGEYPALLRVCRADSDLWQFMKTPLILALLAFSLTPHPNDTEADLTAKRALLQKLETDADLSTVELRDHIFMSYVRERYKHEERRGLKQAFPYDELFNFLGRVAIEKIGMYAKWGYAEGISDNVLVPEDFRIAFVGREREIDIFIELGKRLHVLQERSDRTHAFVHLLLRDALAHTFSREHLRDEELYKRIYNPNPALALGTTGTSEDALLLVSILQDESLKRTIRLCAIDGLGEIADDQSRDALIQAVSSDDELITRRAIAKLGKIGGTSSRDALIAILQDSQHPAREVAINALFQIGDLASMIELLKEKDPELRRQTVEALCRMGVQASLDFLLSALHGADSYGMCQGL